MAKPKKGALAQFLVPMVDATDFASIESAITESDFNSGVTKKFYGWNHGGSAATTSGTISKAGSLVHSGVFRITLKTTENNYDMMMIRLSKTGCAEQIISWENVDNDDSDLMSALTVIQSMASDAASAAAQGNSRILLTQSRVSDIQSALAAGVSIGASDMSDLRSAIAAGPTGTLTASDISDIASAVWANTIGARVDSRLLLTQSRVSDVQSYLVALSDAVSNMHSDLASLVGTTGVALNASTLSDLRSAITAGPTGVLTTSDISDIASAVWAHTTGAAAASRITINQSRISDIQSYLSDMHSNLLSFISGAGPTVSDLASAVAVEIASDISDLLSRTTQINSRVLLNQSRISDVQSALTANNSNLLSFLGTTGVSLDASTLSDLRSAITAGPTGVVSASDISDIVSALRANLASDLSDILSAAQAGSSRALLNQSRVSDVYSMLSDFYSDFTSKIAAGVATRSQLSDLHSDLRSQLTAGVSISASDMSDLRSAIAAGPAGALTDSNISDIVSAVRANLASDISDILSAAQAGASRALLNQSRVSDIYSLLSDLNSNFDSRVTAPVATSSQAVVLQSMASDAHSAAAQANSRALVVQSMTSDAYSLLGQVGVGVSGISDIASAVWAYQGAEPTTVVAAAATYGATLDWLRALSRNRITQTATVQSLRNDANNADIASAAVSDDGTTAVRAEWSN
jgi:hypothetical protein